MANTTEQDLEIVAAGAENFQETYNNTANNLEIGRQIYVSEYGEDVDEFEVVCVKQADDLYWLADGNDTALQDVLGIATADRTDGQDGHLYSNGALVTNALWDWDLSKGIFLSDTPGALTQTPGTNPIRIGIPTAPTKMLVAILHLNFGLAHQADYVVTATTPGTGADATTWSGAQCTAAYTDIVGLQAEITAIHARLEALKINLTA